MNNSTGFVVTAVVVLLVSEIVSFILNDSFLSAERMGYILLGIAIGYTIWIILDLKKKDDNNDNGI